MTRVYVVLPYTAVTLNALTAFTHIVKLCVVGTFSHACCVVTCIREVYVMARCIANMGPPGRGCRCSLEFDAGICAFDGCICTTSSPAHSEHALHEVGFFANSTQGKTMKGFHRQLSSCLSLFLSPLQMKYSLMATVELMGGLAIMVRFVRT
ncbi:hypothetical protein FVEG_15643 [Fusarium verticillioides 7600]|uniref:Uncharacterized protein n=1 Tax=Gibberella moniliformis (strain M3125 / FGSC 7600) TaxID=334819 RepID=W7MAD0_GIBM7|nr:hypothetical protein FVEG_15643 [Fusarium verticillioides 7600]EWG44394.1 hypothetical protein FVEG_15643 [Fusarium verticillioides 7600]